MVTVVKQFFLVELAPPPLLLIQHSADEVLDRLFWFSLSLSAVSVFFPHITTPLLYY